MTTPPLSPTERTTVHRGSDRARTDRSALHDVLDAGLMCQLGLVVDNAPLVLPTGYGHQGNTLYLHGSTGARSMRALAAGAQLCASVTVLDGVVYGRSVKHFSMNYRAAVIRGRGIPVTEAEAKTAALRVITEHLAPGSWNHARRPNKRELAQTAVLAVDLTEASVKVRSGGAGDEPEDVEADAAWAGVLPVRRSWAAPVPNDDLSAGFPVPQHIRART